MEERLNELMRRIDRLTAENQTLHQQVGALAQQQAAREMGPELVHRLEGLPAALAEVLARGGAGKGHGRSLVDGRGIGRPPTFDNKEASFVTWTRKVENYAASVYSVARRVLPWAAEGVDAITLDDVALEFEGEAADYAEFSEQLYGCLLALTDAESFDLVANSPSGSGFEAWRRLHRRWDPLTAGRARGLLREILNPGRAKNETLLDSVERLEDLMRRYECRRSASGERFKLSEDIRMASLEALLPEELERHVQLNRARLGSYTDLRAEVVMFAETRSGGGGGRFSKPSAARRAPDAMDVDALGQGSLGRYGGGAGRGKGKGRGGDDKKPGRGGGRGGAKEERECWTCGRKGHLSADCWHRKDGEAEKSRTPSGKGKDSGKKGSKGRGRGGKGSKSAGALDDEGGGEPEQEVAVFDISSYAAALGDSGGGRPAELDEDGWLRINLDTGAAASVWPEAACYGKRQPAETSRVFKTATGECVRSGSVLTVSGEDAWGQTVRVKGHTAPVHKPLAAASDVTKNGGVVVLTRDGGYMIHEKSPLKARLEKSVSQVLAGGGYAGTTPLYKERGVYNFYVRLGRGAFGLSPLEGATGDEKMGDTSAAAASGGSASSSGGRRRGTQSP